MSTTSGCNVPGIIPRKIAARRRTLTKSDEKGRLNGAYEALKERISSGQYPPNHRLTENDLVQLLGVSRPTVRSVLAKLNNDGLVELEPMRGARIKALTRDEALRILDVREVLEGLAASLAASKITDAQLAVLESILEEMAEAWRKEEYLDHTRLNDRFHETILTAADHDLVRKSIEALHFPLIRYRLRIGMLPGRKQKSLAEHKAVYDALRRRDRRGAEEAMRAHVAQVRAAVASCDSLLIF